MKNRVWLIETRKGKSKIWRPTTNVFYVVEKHAQAECAWIGLRYEDCEYRVTKYEAVEK